MANPRRLPSWRQVTEWHVRSQQVSRRNALIASTALADRRRQRIEAEEFVEALYRNEKEGTSMRAVRHL